MTEVKYQHSVMFHDGTPVPTILTTQDVIKFFRLQGKHPTRSVNRLCNQHGLPFFMVNGNLRRFFLNDVIKFAEEMRRGDHQ